MECSAIDCLKRGRFPRQMLKDTITTEEHVQAVSTCCFYYKWSELYKYFWENHLTTFCFWFFWCLVTLTFLCIAKFPSSADKKILPKKIQPLHRVNLIFYYCFHLCEFCCSTSRHFTDVTTLRSIYTVTAFSLKYQLPLNHSGCVSQW